MGSSDVSPGEGRRSRFVLMHPDLGLGIGTAESEYCSVIRVGNVNVAASNTISNALALIGVHLDHVRDIDSSFGSGSKCCETMFEIIIKRTRGTGD